MHVRFFRRVAFVVGMSLVVGACGQYSISNLRALKSFKDANDLYRRNEYKGAAAKYEEALSYNPDFLGSAYFFLGNCYDSMYKASHKGEPDNDANLPKAVANYQLAIEKIKDDEVNGQGAGIRKRSFEFLIAAYGAEKLNDPTKAEPIAKQLIAADPADPSSYQVLGKIYEESQRAPEAEAQFKKAVDVKPSDATGYQVLAGFYNRQADFEKTMEALQGRANVEPNNPEAWQMMASYYQEKALKDYKLPIAKQKEYVDRGLTAVDKAIALNAEYYEAVSYKNILLRMKAKFENNPAAKKALTDEADVLYKRALDLQKKQNAGKGGD